MGWLKREGAPLRNDSPIFGGPGSVSSHRRPLGILDHTDPCHVAGSPRSDFKGTRYDSDSEHHMLGVHKVFGLTTNPTYPCTGSVAARPSKEAPPLRGMEGSPQEPIRATGAMGVWG